MKTQIKTAILALALAAATSAQAQNYNGDLIIGFTLQSGNDLMFDLGAPLPANGQTWNLNSLLGGLNSASVKWGVVGSDANTGIGYTTKALGVPGALDEQSWTSQDLAVQGIYSLFAVAGPGESTAPSSALANSWNQQTINGGNSTTYKNTYQNPNTTGYGSTTLYSSDFPNGGTPTALGTFSFGADGVVTFNSIAAVPEPGTYGVLAGAGLLIVSLGNKLRRKQV